MLENQSKMGSWSNFLFKSYPEAFKDVKGMSLLEVIVALTIFSIASLMLAYTMTSSIRQDLKNTLRDQGYTLLNSSVNRLKSLGYNHDNLSDTSGTDNHTDNMTIPINDKIDYEYNINWGVEEIDFDNTSDAIKKVTVKVLWPKPHRAEEGERDDVSAIFFMRKKR